nr:MAG TPA: hypothetical protein [Caudoviricetes sp.]
MGSTRYTRTRGEYSGQSTSPLEVHRPIHRLKRWMNNIKADVVFLVFSCLGAQLLSASDNSSQQLRAVRLLVVRLQDKQLQSLIHANSVTRISSSQLHITAVNGEQSLDLFIREKITWLIPQIAQVLQLAQIRNKNTHLTHRRRKINITHETSIAIPL